MCHKWNIYLYFFHHIFYKHNNSCEYKNLLTDEIFVTKYLPQYPQIATIIAGTGGIIDYIQLFKHIDKFSKQDQLSIVKLIRNKLDLNKLEWDIPFDIKKYLVKVNKINLDSDQRIYVAKDDQAIVLLTLGEDIKVGLYTEDDEYPNIKLNKRTSKYLLDYPELDKIPLKNLVKLSKEDIIDGSIITKVLDNAKKDPNSAIVVKDVDGKEIVLDSNTFASYEVLKNGNIITVPFDNEDVQKAFTDSKDNEAFQQNAISIFGTDENIPKTIDKEALMSVVKATPYNKRTLQYENIPSVILTGDSDAPFFMVPATLNPRQQRPLVNYDNLFNTL